MRIELSHIAALLTAWLAAAAIAPAAVASADESTAPDSPSPPSQSCTQIGGSEYKCDAPGNVQLNDAPPVTNFFPQGDD
jgi:hypothetical protein